MGNYELRIIRGLPISRIRETFCRKFSYGGINASLCSPQFVSASDDVVWSVDIARSAARLACGWSSGKLGRFIGSVPYQNLKKVLPISPNAPTAIGMNEKFASMILPITSSAESVLFVISLVPPVLRANFIFSQFLSRRSNS